MLTFKQKRKYRFLATMFILMTCIDIIIFILMVLSVFNNWFGMGDINPIKLFLFVCIVLGIIVTQYVLGVYYQSQLNDYLRKIKQYRLNRHFHMIVNALNDRDYDNAIEMYNNLIPDNTDQGTILYGAFLFVLQNSRDPEHIVLSKQHMLNILNKFSYNNIFK